MSLQLKLGADFSDIQKQAKALETTIDGLGVSLSKLNRDVKLSLIPELDTATIQTQISKIKESVIDISGKIDINSTDAQAAIKSIQSKLSSLDDLSVDITANKTQIESVINEISSDLLGLREFSQIPITLKDAGVREQISSIQSQLSFISEIDIKANKTQAENAIKQVLSELNSIRSENVVIKADGGPAISVIDKIESELNSLVGKLEFDTTGFKEAIQKIQSQAGELIVPVKIDVQSEIQRVKAELQSISTSAKVGVDTSQFDAAIKEVQGKIAALDAPDIDLTANPAQVEATLKEITSELSRLKGSVITLDANGRPAIKSINELEKELADLEKDLKAATNPKDFQNLAKAAGLVREQIRGLSSNNLPASLGRISKSSGEATQTFINLSRVVQDAPYGFIGIANNINPLVESFQRLQVASKQTGTSLISNLGTALSGAGGVGLGIGIVSSLLVTFGDRLFSSTKGVDGLSFALGGLSLDLDRIKSNFDSLERSTKFLQSLEDIKIDIRFGTGNLEGGLAKLQTELFLGEGLKNQLEKDVASAFDISSKSSRAALDKLSEKGLRTVGEIGVLFKDIPEIVASSLSEADQKLIKFAADSERGLADLQRKLTVQREQNTLLVKRIELQQLEIQKDATDKLKSTFEKRLADFEKFQNEIISKAKQFSKEFGNAFVTPDLEISFFKDKDAVFKDASKLLSDVGSFLEGNIKALKVKLPLQVETKTVVDEILRDINGVITEVKSHKVVIPIITELDFIPVTEGISQDVIEGFIKSAKIEKSFPLDLTIDPNIILSKDLTKAIDEKLSLKKQFSDLGADDLFNDIFKNVNSNNIVELLDALDDAKAKLLAIKSIADTVKQSFINAFSSLGEDIGNAISGGGNLFGSLFQIIGAGVEALGKQIIALGVAALKVKASLAQLLANPGLAIAAGVALTAIGVAMKNVAGKGVKGFAEGGFVSGKGGAKQDKIPAMLSNGEFVVNAAATRKHLGLLSLINNGFKLPKLADGGLVSGLTVNASLPSIDSFRGLLDNFSAPQQSRLTNKTIIRGRQLVLLDNRERRSQRI